MESHLAAESKKDQYDIGSGDSKWPKSGDVHDDTGNGPGVSGAKELSPTTSGKTKGGRRHLSPASFPAPLRTNSHWQKGRNRERGRMQMPFRGFTD